MNLDLAVTLKCSDSGCEVRMVRGGEVLTARYSAKVQGRIQIRRGQLVALDTSPPIPEIVWRWVRVRALEVNESSVGIDDRLGYVEFADRVPSLPLSLSTGDEVWSCNTDEALEVHDLVVEGQPAHPERLLAHIAPIIERVYAA